MKKKIMSLLMVILVFGLVACNTHQKETLSTDESVESSEPMVSEEQATIELAVGFQTVTEAIEVKEETQTLFDVLTEAFDITYESYDFGPMLRSIGTKDGGFTIEPPTGSFIAIYIDGEPSMVGVHEIYVQKGQTYRLTLEWWDQEAHIAYIIDRFLNDYAADYVNAHTLDIYTILALAHLGRLEDFLSLEDALNYFSSIDANNTSVSELYKAILTIRALGGDVTDVHHLNLVDLLLELDYTHKYSAPYALIGFNSGYHDVDVSEAESELLKVLTETNPPSSTLGLDLSGITLAALAPYIEDEQVSTVVQAYIEYLEDHMNEWGGIRDEQWGLAENAASLAQLIIGLIAVDVNRTSHVLTDEHANLIDRLLAFSNDDGTFYWTLESESADLQFSTPQAILALVLYQKYKEQEQAVLFYDFTFGASHDE